MADYAFCPNRDENYCPQRGTSCQHPSGDCEDRRLVIAKRHLPASGITSHSDIIRKIVQAGIAKGMLVPD